MRGRENRMIHAVAQAELFGQLKLRHVFKPFEDQTLFNATCSNQPIAMIAILQGQVIRLHRLPKRHIAQRVKPFGYIVDILKNHHPISISNYWPETKFYEEMSALSCG